MWWCTGVHLPLMPILGKQRLANLLSWRPAWVGEPNLDSEGEKAGEDVIENGSLFQSQQAADLGSFGYTVLALELRIEEMGYGIFLRAQGKPLRSGMCQGCP